MAKKKSNARKIAEKEGFRSYFEYDISKQLTSAKIKWVYEPRDMIIPYSITKKSKAVSCAECGCNKIHTSHTYLPDFYLEKYDLIIEAKGYFRQGAADRRKLEQMVNDGVRLVVLFQSPSIKINTSSKTTYSDWANKKGVKWLSIKDPKWISKLKSIY